MLAQSRSPENLSLQELDSFLARGWFRMGQTIFTTNFLRYDGKVYSTIWLRILLNEYQANASQLNLFKRNLGFRTSIQLASITPEKEELYLRYQQSLDFPTSESLLHLLLNDCDTPSIYTTYEVTVHDGDRLIAIGFFDIGETSAEGIVSVYDPEYKKYSLGKYLIYQKILYCQRMNLRYFYPGYFVPGNPYFDYKLSIGRPALRYLQLQSQQWLSMDQFSSDSIPYQRMHEKLVLLETFLAQTNQPSKVVTYEYFDAGLLPDLREAETLDFPVFLFSGNESEGILPLIVFDVRDACYHLLFCITFLRPEVIHQEPGYYSSYLLKVIQEIHATDQIEEMVLVFTKLITSVRKADDRPNIFPS